LNGSKPSPDARGWYPNRDWRVRARARQNGNESKQKYPTYEAARAEARQMRATGQYREIWIEVIEPVFESHARPWRDLEPKEQSVVDIDRQHFTSVEEDGE
jgi:hypothetical protein